jgi:uncharacterized protein (TIGR00369 family)
MAEDFSAQANRDSTGWVKAMGLTFTEVSVERVRCEWDVGEQHLQPYGIVHGGVYSGVIETVASMGAHLVAMQRGQRAVGLENHTSFLRAVGSGRLRAEARPLTVGRTSHVWEASITNAEGKLVSRGTVRILCIDEERQLGGPPPQRP